MASTLNTDRQRLKLPRVSSAGQSTGLYLKIRGLGEPVLVAGLPVPMQVFHQHSRGCFARKTGGYISRKEEVGEPCLFSLRDRFHIVREKQEFVVLLLGYVDAVMPTVKRLKML